MRIVDIKDIFYSQEIGYFLKIMMQYIKKRLLFFITCTLISTFCYSQGIDVVAGWSPRIAEATNATTTPETLVNPNKTEIAGDTTTDKTTVRPRTSHPQELWLASLEFCESRGKSDLRIVDVNGYYSYGAFQFQMATFLGFGKQYGVLPKTMTMAEARGDNKDGPIYDREVQKEIATYLAEDGLDYHWLNCVKKFGHYPTN